jgi:hypothetical protein
LHESVAPVGADEFGRTSGTCKFVYLFVAPQRPADADVARPA